MPLSCLRLFGALAVLALAIPLAGSPPAAAEWPQWRGPGGLGVAAAGQSLPASWVAQGAGVRWRTALPGEGTSSPIVVDGRVFVTTAYEGSGGRFQRRLIAAAVLGLGLLVVLRVLAGPASPRWLLLLSLLFVALAAAITLWPDLFYPAGKPGRTWRVTGALALLGLAAAVGWSPPRSRWRLAGIVALLAAAGYVAAFTPPSQIGPAPLGKRLLFVLPGLVAAAGYLRGWWRAGAQRRVARRPLIAALPLLLLALLVFLPPNYLSALLRVVVCLDLDSGTILWERAAFAAPPEQRWPGGTYATPTPASDGERVFAYFGAGLAAFDLDGERQWVRRFPSYTRYARYGAGSSPVLTDDTVIVVKESEAYQGGPPSWIAAFDKRSGRTRWEVRPERARDSYNTPLLVPTGAGESLLTASWGFLAAYDAATGTALWTLDYPMMQVVASMARSGDLVAIAGGAHGDKKLLVVRLAATASAPPEVVWETTRRVSRVSSPVFYDGLLFTLTDNGILSCYDAATGAELWKSRLDGEYFASLLAGDGKLYAVNTEGATSVIAASRDYRLLAVNELGEAVRATPAVAAGRLLIRTASSLVCVEGPQRGAGGG